MTRRTKIVATIGPATERPEQLRALVDAGMDMARVSLSHGPLDQALERMALVREVGEAAGRFVGVLADLPGPKVRAAAFPEGGIDLDAGDRLRLEPGSRADGSGSSSAKTIVVHHAALLHEIEPGDAVAIGDGGILLRVDEVTSRHAVCTVLTGGRVQGKPGVSLPPERSSLSAPTPEDLLLLATLADAGVDAVAISFVRSGEDIDAARVVRPDAMLIAKIETAEAVADLDAIIAAADGVMVARGDLGLRCALEDVPHHQKRIIRTGVAFGRPVITATQMLESMIHAATPTRAEVTDVANAVFDGTSALMLSGETAVGEYAVEAVETMARVAERAEADFDYQGWGRALGRLQTATATSGSAEVRITAAVSAAAWRASVDADVAAIIACTNTGATARAISRFRPRVPVIAATPSVRTAHQLSVAWGITPMLTDRHATTDDIVWFAVQTAVQRRHVRSGDLVAVLVGSPKDPSPTTDTLRLVRVR